MGDKSQKDKAKDRKQKIKKNAIDEQKKEDKQDKAPVSGALKSRP
jgi:hypothetical protein